MDTPYSLANPPKAPKKRYQPSILERRGRFNHIPKLVLPEKKAEWQLLAESGCVRQKFLNYTPEDIEEIDDIHTLLLLEKWYFPASQPHNVYEETYLAIMLDAIRNKLHPQCSSTPKK